MFFLRTLFQIPPAMARPMAAPMEPKSPCNARAIAICWWVTDDIMAIWEQMLKIPLATPLKIWHMTR